jgi:hypothetical protein
MRAGAGLDRAAHGFDELAGDGQAEARTASSAVAQSIATVEAVEDAGEVPNIAA